ncbi:MAG TPA: hypothetical protein PKO30_00410 [Prolixibacteraceae bacterium]|nr:hypothetical protein [Prolixibacteraceae bacterium]
MPVVGVWMWGFGELRPNGYKRTIDQVSKQSPFNLLIPFLRFANNEVTDTIVQKQVKLAAEYGVSQNVLLTPDLDVRSARRAFQRKHPNELQQMLRLKEVKLSGNNYTETVIPSLDLNDHYSGGDIMHHVSISGSLLRVYAYNRTQESIDSQTLQDITKKCTVEFATKDSVKVKIPIQNKQTNACVMVSFTHFYPDIFAPHLMEFQREIIEQYAGIPLGGVCKDEWGYPPYYPRFFRLGLFDFWYSPYLAEAYSAKTKGRNLLADCLLMSLDEKGKETERFAAINNLTEMTRLRNIDLEGDFYNTVKKVFGPDAAVTVHSTWWPYPDRCEFKKNGLDWWASKRDWAQTDEVVPYAVRTALTKKWGSPVWYNMYYKADLAPQMWSSALAGGRLNYLSYFSIFTPELMRAENRIRLLNYVSKSPLDCPVAVIFGHTSAVNWGNRNFEDLGMPLVDSLWHNGYPADLIPTSEIENGSLRVDSSGAIWYGKQRYTAAVLYNPEFEKSSTSDFFRKAEKGSTALFRIGDWTRNFDGKPVKGDRLLPKSMAVSKNTAEIVPKIIQVLQNRKIQKQTPATGILDNKFFQLKDFDHTSCAPPTTGWSRLIDGTIIHVAGTKQVSGDTIRTEFKIDKFAVSLDAVGVAAIRLDKSGNVKTFAASSLKHLKTGNFEINLGNRIDVALWKDEKDEWQGVIQSENPVIPNELLAITKNWVHLSLPTPPEMRRFNAR